MFVLWWIKNMMDEALIMQYVSTYGYVVLLPLMIAEGPIITMIAAFLASVGALNVWLVFFLSVVGDMIGDVILFWIGQRWGLRFVDRFGSRFGMTRTLVARIENFFRRHGGKTVVIAKTTTGLCWVTFVVAGIVNMPIHRFVWYSFLGGVMWSAFLVAMGYFFGYMYDQISAYISNAGWIVFGVALLVLAGIYIVKKFTTRGVLDNLTEPTAK